MHQRLSRRGLKNVNSPTHPVRSALPASAPGMKTQETQEKHCFETWLQSNSNEKRVEGETSTLFLRTQDMNGLALQHVKLSVSALSQSSTCTLSQLNLFQAALQRFLFIKQIIILIISIFHEYSICFECEQHSTNSNKQDAYSVKGCAISVAIR